MNGMTYNASCFLRLIRNSIKKCEIIRPIHLNIEIFIVSIWCVCSNEYAKFDSYFAVSISILVMYTFIIIFLWFFSSNIYVRIGLLTCRVQRTWYKLDFSSSNSFTKTVSCNNYENIIFLLLTNDFFLSCRFKSI